MATIRPKTQHAAPLSSNEFTPTTEPGLMASSKKQFTKRRTSKATFGLFFRMEPRNTFTL